MKLGEVLADPKLAQSLIKRRFLKLRDTDVEEVGVNHDRLVGLVREQYNLSVPRAELEVGKFVNKVHQIKTEKLPIGELDSIVGDDDTPYKLDYLFADPTLAQTLIRRRFLNLSNTDVEQVGLSHDKLVWIVQAKYKLSEPTAQVRVGNFLRKVHLIQTKRFLGEQILNLAGDDDTSYPRPGRKRS